MTGPINIIVASEDDLRRIVREEIAAATAPRTLDQRQDHLQAVMVAMGQAVHPDEERRQ